MKIDLSKDEYMALVEMLQIAGWVIHSHAVEATEETRAYRDLEQKVLSHAEEFSCEDLIEYDETTGRYYPTADFEEAGTASRFIQDFEEDTFWAQLAKRLSERDLARELGKDQLGALDQGDQWEQLETHETRYWDEFEQHGIERLEIVELPWHEIPNMPRA